MKKRSITDEEIALIKGMLNIGMANADIQFYFNRPKRRVNSGRISGIASGSYSNSADIPAAQKTQVKEFVTLFNDNIIDTSQLSSKILTKHINFRPQKADKFFETTGGQILFSGFEGEKCECKKDFHIKYRSTWMKAVAGLANNKGGFIFFGIEEASGVTDLTTEEKFRVVGMTNGDFDKTDTAEITKLLKATFDPTPEISRYTITKLGLKIGVLEVKQHASRPIIAARSDKNISEGDIYYRYSAQTSKIKYSDLRAILDERDIQARNKLAGLFQQIIKVGPEKVVVGDIESGEFQDATTSFHINPELIEQLKFIKEGEFNEKAGAPAIKIIGQAEDTNGYSVLIKEQTIEKAISKDDIFERFLDQTPLSTPEEYLTAAITSHGNIWFPIHYFAQCCKFDKQQLLNFIENSIATEHQKGTYSERARRKQSAFKKPSSLHEGETSDIARGHLPKVQNAKEAMQCANAIMGLTKAPICELSEVLSLLSKCHKNYGNISKHGCQSVIRRAIARIDEIYFGR